MNCELSISEINLKTRKNFVNLGDYKIIFFTRKEVETFNVLSKLYPFSLCFGQMPMFSFFMFTTCSALASFHNILNTF